MKTIYMNCTIELLLHKNVDINPIISDGIVKHLNDNSYLLINEKIIENESIN